MPDATILHSVNENGIKNSAITNRGIGLFLCMLGPMKCASQGKSTCEQLDVVDVSL